VDPVKFADYHLWANNRVRGKLMELTENEYCKDLIPPLNSIKNHVLHSILAVEYNLRVRVNGEKADPYEISDAIVCMSIPDAMQHWEKMDRQLVAFASTHLDLNATFPNFLGERTMQVNHDDFLTQYVVHTVYHRGQIMSALRMMGKEGVGTDYLFYLSHLENSE
jgi:uncharacterized damage-inducible protein DinB